MSTIYTTYTDAYSAWGYKKGKSVVRNADEKASIFKQNMGK